MMTGWPLAFWLSSVKVCNLAQSPLPKCIYQASFTHVLKFTSHLYENNEINSFNIFPLSNSQDSVVGTAAGYGLDDLRVGVRVSIGSTIFCHPCSPDRI
jgi:hypothetical protein